MKISVRVTPNAKSSAKVVGKNSPIEELEDGTFKVWLSSVPENGKANEELIALLSKHFGCKKNQVRIVLGETTRNKVIEIIENI